ncbi:TPA: hypothetical protein ACKQIG_000924 [Serratia marcescens]
MDNKLSELSKPVVWVPKSQLAMVNSGDAVLVEADLCAVQRFNEDPLYSQEYVSALQHESAVNWEAATSLVAESEELKRALEASKKSNAFLKEQLAQLANFNPDWDMLEACRESWREVAAALKEAEATLEAKDKRIAELEAKLREMTTFRDNAVKKNGRRWEELLELRAKLATPVQLQNCDFESVAIMAHWCTDEQLKAWVKGVEHAKKQIRAAGFKVEGG